jgi:hypothetical protein
MTDARLTEGFGHHDNYCLTICLARANVGFRNLGKTA